MTMGVPKAPPPRLPAQPPQAGASRARCPVGKPRRTHVPPCRSRAARAPHLPPAIAAAASAAAESPTPRPAPPARLSGSRRGQVRASRPGRADTTAVGPALPAPGRSTAAFGCFTGLQATSSVELGPDRHRLCLRATCTSYTQPSSLKLCLGLHEGGRARAQACVYMCKINPSLMCL